MTTMTREHPHRAGELAHRELTALHRDLGGLLTRGAVAGLTAGWAFILANMWFAASQGGPAVAPFLAISTVFHASAKPVVSPENVVVGLTLHLALSLAFGLGFAFLVPLLRRAGWLFAGGAAYGLALYLLNFQILGRTVFPFFTSPAGPNQVFEVLVHPLVFGLLLAPFFLGWHPAPAVSEQAVRAGR
jgi:hypothetical protein